MDLRSLLLRYTPPRPLLVVTPGGTEARLAVERLARERGWRTATTPAEANVLVVAGPANGAVESHVDAVWSALPAPRARADVPSAAEAFSEMERAMGSLRDVRGQREQACRATAPAEEEHHGNGHEQHGGHGDHSQHGGHDMGGMEMPGGIPMAERAEDRDGLTLDQLHVPLGPVLPDWPAGLLVDAVLQGDVLTDAEVRTVGLAEPSFDPFWARHQRGLPADPVRGEQARQLDACATLLTVAGWADAASAARRIRDELLSEQRAPMADARVEAWGRRVERSRVLRLLLSGVGPVPARPGTPEGLHGDALSRLHRWLDTIREPGRAGDHSGEQRIADRLHETRWALDALPGLLRGSELATARLAVASLDLDLELLTTRDEIPHG